MQADTPQPKNEMICPECGSNEVILEENNEVISSMSNKPLNQYSCKSCKCKFIPATIISQELATPLKENINKWSKKVRIHEGNNDGKSWIDDKSEFIKITPKMK